MGTFSIHLFLILSFSYFSYGLNIHRPDPTEESSSTLLVSPGQGSESQVEIQLKKLEDENSVSVTDLKEKKLTDGVDVNYPELVPGRPVTTYLVVGIIFLVLTLSPYILYGIYVIFVPEFLRPDIKSKFRRRRGRDVGHLQFEEGQYGQVLQVTQGKSECLEKIMCRVSKRAHQFGVGDWMGLDGSLLEHISSLSSSWRHRLYRGMWSGSLQEPNCGQFHCDPMARLWGDWRNTQQQQQEYTNEGSQGTPLKISPSMQYDENYVHD